MLEAIAARWIAEAGVPALYATSAYFSMKTTQVPKGAGYSVSWCSNFMKAIVNHLSQQECLMKWNDCCVPARLREIFGGNVRERMEYVGGDKTIVRDVDAQLNNLNKAFPVIAKAWETKLLAINMCAISVAPRGEDRVKEAANRLTWESFIVLQDNQPADEQQQRAFINNLLYSKNGTKKFIDVFDENFGEEGVPAWWRISEIFPPRSLLRSFPPFPPQGLSPAEIFSLFLSKILCPLSLLRSFRPFPLRLSRSPFPLRPFQIFPFCLPKIFSLLSL